MAEWITGIINALGYVGIGFLMFLENLFPPIPSELIMPLAGFTVARGSMNFGLVLLAGVAGTMLGALPWYFAGRVLGGDRLKRWADRYGKWLGISSEDIQKSITWFRKHGSKAVFLGRLVPGIRTLISIPAGTCDMAFVPFLLYSTLGTLAWVTLLTYAGFALGHNYVLVEEYVGPLSKIVLAIVLVIFIVVVAQRRRRRNV
ncbi:DedA family protein [Oculatella sp. LEGE 06141]|uniref:DedA family protein n=1 Tax=Oculatella sp. LEGE 06141 TaxID=1828648 RepID=UPI0018817D3B|nr:DedA family protein [Oculatella sp. LEGE 06141]MBE9181515.1 DedA family protein [Oculatella sp. LEGE 06141]